MGQKDLNQYLREANDKHFHWGEHDCLIFSNHAFKAYHGYAYGEDWLGRYLRDGKPKTTQEMREEYGFENFEEAINTRLTKIDDVPPKGSLVATQETRQRHRALRFLPYALGISVGTKAAFVSDKGIIYLPLDSVTSAWIAK